MVTIKKIVFLDGRTKHLLKCLTPPSGYTLSAIASLVGQGCLYILPCDEVTRNYNVVCFMPLPISRLLLQHQQTIQLLLYNRCRSSYTSSSFNLSDCTYNSTSRASNLSQSPASTVIIKSSKPAKHCKAASSYKVRLLVKEYAGKREQFQLKYIFYSCNWIPAHNE